MQKKIGLTILLIMAMGMLYAQSDTTLQPLIQNVYSRNVQSLNGNWNYIIDPMEVGYYDYRLKPSPYGFFTEPNVDNVNTFKEFDFDLSPVMKVPGDWNTQNPQLFYYEGTVWFKHKFSYSPSGNKAFLYFGAVNYDAKVYLNGKKAGEHTGGFTPFNFEVTSLLKEGENTVIVKVDNKRYKDAVPTVNCDWFNYGGITRDVMLVEVPQSFIQSYKVQLKKGSNDIIAASVRLSGEKRSQKVTVEIPELKVKRELTTDENGVASVEIPAKPQLWSPENPKLYKVTIADNADAVTDEIGFRTIETKGNRILLNGKPVFLKGISIHEEAPYRSGRINKEEECYTLLSWAKELGCNYVRLAHYPHNEKMVRLADKMGLMVWSEIPVYWTISWENETTYQNARNQLSEMVERDQNRAAVIIWSMANETPHSDARDKFLSGLATTARTMDNTRLISMAMERSDKSPTVLSVKDNMSEYVDVISFNEYVGWYDGRNEKLDRVKWEIDYNKPLIISEFGGGAVYGLHGDVSRIWTEEHQSDIYSKTLRMIDERMPLVSGISPWILMDFRSPRRLLPQVQDGFNRKGVVSDKGERKMAFYVLQSWFKNKKAPAEDKK